MSAVLLTIFVNNLKILNFSGLRAANAFSLIAFCAVHVSILYIHRYVSDIDRLSR